MLRTMIIDDESRARSALKQDIQINCPDLEIVGEAGSISTALPLLQELQPDLVFLDIQLSDGLSFTILDSSSGLDAAIIFTTAYSEYALQAFKTNAIAYLLKPIDRDELVHAVEEVKRIRQLSVSVPETKAISSLEELADKQTRKILLHTTDGMHILQLGDIIRCNSYGNYSFVYLTDGTRLMVSKILKDIESLLEGYGFERVHHSHVINMNHIKSFRNKDGGVLLMSDKSEVPVSLRKKSGFLELLQKINSAS